jgi:hypothetical protein
MAAGTLEGATLAGMVKATAGPEMETETLVGVGEFSGWGNFQPAKWENFNRR